jgi:hypothetical protein
MASAVSRQVLEMLDSHFELFLQKAFGAIVRAFFHQVLGILDQGVEEVVALILALMESMMVVVVVETGANMMEVVVPEMFGSFPVALLHRGFGLVDIVVLRLL